jgi:hypothetical protein
VIMPTREDDDLDMLAGLSASRDDAPGSAKPKQRSAPQANPANKTAQPSASSAQRPAGSVGAQAVAQPAAKSGKGLLWFMFVLLLIVIGACAWLGQQVMQLQQQQAASSNALQLERSRVESISAQVHETGSSFVETGNVLESKFKFFDSEIRKLWDVANKRNRKGIEANKTQLAKTAKSTQSAQTKLKTLATKQAATSKSTDKLSRQLASENTALRATVEAQNEQLLIMEAEMELLQQRLKNVPNDLAVRVANNEEAVQAIDASRQQLFKRISQLQQQLDSLQRPVQPAP